MTARDSRPYEIHNQDLAESIGLSTQDRSWHFQLGAASALKNVYWTLPWYAWRARRLVRRTRRLYLHHPDLRGE